MWIKRPQSLGSYRDEVSVLMDFSKFGLFAVLQGSSAHVWQYVGRIMSTTVKSQAKGFLPCRVG